MAGSPKTDIDKTNIAEIMTIDDRKVFWRVDVINSLKTSKFPLKSGL